LEISNSSSSVPVSSTERPIALDTSVFPDLKEFGKSLALSRYGQPKAFEIQPSYLGLAGSDLIERLGLAPSIHSGFPYLTPVGKLLVNSIETRIRELARSFGFLEIELPTVSPTALIEKTGVLDQFAPEIMKLSSPHDSLHLSATTEEPLLAYLERMGITSYRDFPLQLFHFNDVYRWLQRTKGFFSTREIHTCICALLSTDQDMLIDGVERFSQMCVKLWQDCGIEIKVIRADSGDAVEHFYSGSRSDRRLSDSVAVTKSADGSAELASDSDNLMTSLCMAYTYKHMSKFALEVNGANGERIVPSLVTCGIGIQRILIALFDQNRDSNGVSFPKQFRPWDVVIVPLDNEQLDLAYRMGPHLHDAGYRTIIDDRTGRSLGSRLQTWDFWGTPARIVIGDRESSKGECEVRFRGARDKKIINSSELIGVLKDYPL